MISKFDSPWLEDTYNAIINTHINGKPHHALLVSYEEGAGEQELFNKIIKYILCIDKGDSKYACNKCSSCLSLADNDYSMPDLYTLSVEEGDHLIKKEAIEEALLEISKFPIISNSRIIFVPDFTKITVLFQNAILKSIEEPPPNTFFIFGILKSYEVLPTIKSRCQLWNIKEPTKDEFNNYLINKGLSNDKLHILNILSNCNPLLALEMNELQWDTSYMTFLDSVYSVYNSLEIDILLQNLVSDFDSKSKQNLKINIKKLIWKLEFLCMILSNAVRIKIINNEIMLIDHNLVEYFINLDSEILLKTLNDTYNYILTLKKDIGINSNSSSINGLCLAFASKLILNRYSNH